MKFSVPIPRWESDRKASLSGLFASGNGSLTEVRSEQVGLRTQPKSNWIQVEPHDAAVTVLRGYGGTFPSQPAMSGPKGFESTGRRGRTNGVMTHGCNVVDMHLPTEGRWLRSAGSHLNTFRGA